MCDIVIVQYTVRSDTLNTQFKKGILELCVLCLIEREDMSGYQLVEQLGEYVEVSVNTIYPILRRLTSEGVLATYEVYDSGRKRKYYVLSNPGKEYYKKLYDEWLSFNNSVEALLKEESNNE
ncbi:PadR family transcriptional regulator PadR [Bacilli bacterium PM5-3]|nr:PadR family transcriptional regulator PadR [Bacilli bacterium PM5-3]MDH6603858.1 PadR family transcriptional regulator PadR [Bacilli bacterium PM5-9]